MGVCIELIDAPCGGTDAGYSSFWRRQARSLFSLGALLAVVEAGYHESIVAISSVSGGSITNAAIAAAFDFSEVTREEFRDLVDDLAAKLQRKRHRIRMWWLLLVALIRAGRRVLSHECRLGPHPLHTTL